MIECIGYLGWLKLVFNRSNSFLASWLIRSINEVSPHFFSFISAMVYGCYRWINLYLTSNNFLPRSQRLTPKFTTSLHYALSQVYTGRRFVSFHVCLLTFVYDAGALKRFKGVWGFGGWGVFSRCGRKRCTRMKVWVSVAGFSRWNVCMGLRTSGF